jgi:hypothetical protein
LKRFSGFIILLLLVAIIFAPIDVPFTVESVAKAMPVRQWILVKNTDGSLTAALHNHRTGTFSDADAFQFDRGDLVEMKFGSGKIKEGEPVVTITSNRLDEQLVRLKNQLAIEQANLNVVSTGEKQELRKRLEEEINLAKADLKLRKKLLDRAKLSYEEGLVALQDLEIAENAYNESVAQVRVAEEALEVGATGEKQETRRLSASRIESLKREISFFERKQDQYIIPAPFEGLLRSETTVDGDRLLLEDTSETVLFIPIRLKDSPYVLPGQTIELNWTDRAMTFSCEVLEVGERVELLNRDQVVTIKAVTHEKNLPSGMPIRCRIHCGEVRVAEFLKRSIRWQ